jgi:prepilin-type N-terminal cleavage/methylation domain-containing protein
MTERKGFTLIEWLIAISLTVIILAVMHFGLTAALESWGYTRDELGLQQIMNSTLVEMQEGTDWAPGLRSALEVTEALEDRVSFVIPWSEEQTVRDPRGTFQLGRHVKPGSGLPTAEVRLPEGGGYASVPIYWEDPDNFTDRPRLKPGKDLIVGSTIRFAYYPDPARVPEAVVTLGFDAQAQAIFREQNGPKEILGENPLGVVITECRFRYYDQNNTLLAGGGSISGDDCPMVTAVETELIGKSGSRTLTIPGMVMLRNSPRHGGLLILKNRLDVSMPDSRHVRAFALTNITGVHDEDELQLEVKPARGASWRVTLKFGRMGEAKPVIARISVEYPPGRTIFVDRPRTPVDLGVDFLLDFLVPPPLYLMVVV